MRNYENAIFYTSSYELNRPLPKGINKKVIGALKDKIGGKNNEETCWIMSKNLYLKKVNDGSEDKK